MKVLWIILTAVILASCTRPEGETTKVSLNIPLDALKKSGKVGAMSSDDAEGFHISLNVSKGREPFFCGWDSKNGVATVGRCKFSPTSVEVQIPSGPNLIQVFYARDHENGTTFLYGETEEDISATRSTVVVNLTVIGDGNTGHATGRYIGGTAATPQFETGIMQLRYVPNTGSPPMLIAEKEMFGGWFDVFALQGVRIRYDVNGKSLGFIPANDYQPGGMTLLDFKGIAEGLTSTPPAPRRKAAESEDGSHWNIVGWFGPGVSSGHVTRTSTSACTGDLFSTCLYLDSGHKYGPKFLGPFIQTSDGYIKNLEVTGSRYLGFKPLPGGLDHLSGFRVIRLSNITDPDMMKKFFLDSEQWDCVAAAAEPGAQVTEIPKTALVDRGGWQSFAYDLETLASHQVVMLCPVHQKSGLAMKSAALYPNRYNDFGRGGYQGPYLYSSVAGGEQVMIGTRMAREVIQGACHPVTIGSYEGRGWTKIASADTHITLEVPAGKGQFFATDSECLSQTGGARTKTFVIGAGASDVSGYFLSSAADLEQVEIGMTTTSPDYKTNPLLTRTHASRLTLSGPATLSTDGECGRYEVRRMDHRSNPLVAPISENLAFSFVGSGLSAYEDAQCATAKSTFMIGSNQARMHFYMKKSASPASSVTVRFDKTAAPGLAKYQTNELTVASRSTNTDSRQASYVSLSFPDGSTLVPGRCYRARFKLMNAYHEEMPAAAALKFSYTVPQGRFYEMASGGYPCSGLSTNDFSFEPRVSSVDYWFYALAVPGEDVKPDSNGALPNLTLPENSGTIGGRWAHPVNFSGSSDFPVYLAPRFVRPSTDLIPWKNRVIGSHEFGSEQWIQLKTNITEKGELSCNRYLNDVWSSCDDQIDRVNRRLRWTLADAVQGSKYFLSASQGENWVTAEFDPVGVFGEKFTVVQCSEVMPAADHGQVLASTINARLTHSDTSNRRVCLRKGARFLMDTHISMGAGSALVGWRAGAHNESDGAVPDVYSGASNVNGHGIHILNHVGPGVILANLGMYTDATVSNHPTLRIENIESYSNATILISHVQLESWRGGHTAVRVKNIASSVQILFESVGIEANVVGGESPSTGLLVENSAAHLSFERGSITNESLTTDANGVPTLVEIRASAAGTYDSVLINESKMGGSANVVVLDGSEDLVDLTIRKTKIQAVSPSPLTSFFRQSGDGDLHIEHSQLSLTGGREAFLLEGSDWPGDLFLTSNIIKVRSDIPLMKIMSPLPPTLEWAGNHFQRDGAIPLNEGSSAPFIVSSTLTEDLLIEPIQNAPPVTVLGGQGANRICKPATGNFGWASPSLPGSYSVQGVFSDGNFVITPGIFPISSTCAN